MRVGSVLTLIILTRDEEANLPFALSSIACLGARVFVVDSGSVDRTRQIAEAAGCVVVEHPFTNQAEQVNWALQNLPLETEWIMRLDADERITPELAEELRTCLPNARPEVSGFEVKRRFYFWGRWIRHGGYYPTWLLRIWRRGSAASESRWMDEHMVSKGGVIARLQFDIIDENHKSLASWTSKHNAYADREVSDLLSAPANANGLQGQAARKRWMKYNVYGRSPLYLRAFAYWAMRYLVLGGWLDGRAGLVYHFLQGFWYRFLVDAKLDESRLRERVVRRQSGGTTGKRGRGPECERDGT